METLANKIVLITGASGGFGTAMIRQFLQAGSYLVLTDVDPHQMWQAVAHVTALPGNVPLKGKILGCITADLADPAGSDILYAQCCAITPVIDILINNAGIAVVGLFPDVPQIYWERLMQINLLAPMRLTAKFLPLMIKRRSGHIVNIASVAGLVGVPGLSSYCAAKFGLRGLGEAWTAELAPHNIAVTTIYPFFARTPILQSARFGTTHFGHPPDMLVTDPERVIAKLIAGIRRRKSHIYPGAIVRQIDCIRRTLPWLIPLLIRSPRRKKPFA